jgi:membrane-associated phospholipid phosphatase
VGNYIHLVFPGEFDAVIQKMEHFMFGGYPNVMVQKLYNPLLNEIMQLGYAIYWFLIPVSTFLLYFRKKFRELEHLLFITLTTFYVCYIIFILFPVSGPRFNLVEYFTYPYKGLVLVPILRKLVQNAGLRGAAFPSSHVAVSIVIFNFFRKIEPRIAYRIFLPAVIMLSLATVYGRYHYFTDMLAGLFFGQFIFFIYFHFSPFRR